MSIDFAYAQARVQARLGQRLPEDDWGLLESSLGLPQYLTSLRGTVLARHVRHVSQAASVHEIERSLRTDWRAEVAAVTRWVPERWQAAVEWTGWLPYLDAVAYLLRGGAVLAWMRDDPVLTVIAIEDPDARRPAIEASPFGTPDGVGTAAALRTRWLTQWRTLWPRTSRAESAGLQRFAARLRDFDAASVRQAATREDRSEARMVLAFRLARILRQQSQEPVVVFCHLALVALDLQRLRDGLLRRALYRDGAGEKAA